MRFSTSVSMANIMQKEAFSFLLYIFLLFLQCFCSPDFICWLICRYSKTDGKKRFFFSIRFDFIQLFYWLLHRNRKWLNTTKKMFSRQKKSFIWFYFSVCQKVKQCQRFDDLKVSWYTWKSMCVNNVWWKWTNKGSAPSELPVGIWSFTRVLNQCAFYWAEKRYQTFKSQN